MPGAPDPGAGAGVFGSAPFRLEPLTDRFAKCLPSTIPEDVLQSHAFRFEFCFAGRLFYEVKRKQCDLHLCERFWDSEAVPAFKFPEP